MKPALPLLLAACGALLAGCGGEASVRPPCPTGEICMEFGNSAEPGTIDPQKYNSTWEANIIGELMVGLTESGPDGLAVPGMATHWETSADGLTWTFHLRHSKWSDGVELTADDFVYSMRRVMDPQTASEYAFLLYVVKNGEAVNDGKAPLTALGVEAPDPYTLRIHLEHPAPYFLYITTHQVMYPVARHVVEKWGDHWTEPAHWVSNGAYKLAYWTLGDHIRVVRNPMFYDAGSVLSLIHI